MTDMTFRNEDALIKRITDDVADAASPVFIVIDGRCGTGKTTFAERLAAKLHAPVIHVDDFYLPKEKRTPERMEKCGGNIDSERFCAEVMIPLQNGEPFSYRPYDCGKGELCSPVNVPESKACIIEGTYSYLLCPDSRITVFVTATAEEQIARLSLRESAEKLEMFRKIWIPREEKYFETFDVCDKCNYIYDTTDKTDETRK